MIIAAGQADAEWPDKPAEGSGVFLEDSDAGDEPADDDNTETEDDDESDATTANAEENEEDGAGCGF